MPYSAGDHVLVESLGKGVVREVRKVGRYLVEIKGRALLVTERQLSAVNPRAGKAAKATDAAAVDARAPARSLAAASIDLHGMAAGEAAAAVVDFVNAAILAGLAEVRVIHGRSGGRLKVVVRERLKALPSIRGFRIDPANPGVTIVTF